MSDPAAAFPLCTKVRGGQEAEALIAWPNPTVMPSLLYSAILLLSGALAVPRSDQDRPTPEILRERLDQLQAASSIEVGRGQLAARKALPMIYEEAGYQPFWTAERLQTLVALVRESAEDGLVSEDYHLSELEKISPALAASNSDSQTRAQADLLATDAFFLLLYHLYFGKVDPKSLDPNWNFDPRPVGERQGIAFVLEALTKGQQREAVARVRPQHWWYSRARAALAEYRGLAARGGWAAIPAGPVLKPGTKGARVVALRRRLAATGELSGDRLDSDTFDEAVAEAVKKFQTRHHLSPDGIAAVGTLAELNVPLDARIRQIRVNLERGRWALNEITDADFVLVDVAGFEVSYMRKGEAAWKARIQVGKAYSQTPIFKSKIDNVVFNPTWTVPPGIARKEMLPALKKDPRYLEKKGLDLLDGNGRKVDPAGIHWASQGSFPYTVRQPAGPDNALGRVKILFPNPYFVYLHDTPSKSLFEKEDRAFSHGCMRVERPLELAELVLNDPQTWNARSIGEVIEAGETRTVRLKQTVPVLIMYWTIDLSTEGRTGFKRDPYGRDARVARAIDTPYGPRPAAASR
jgi:murein L,D-transpeptidase YcbB/YkuD